MDPAVLLIAATALVSENEKSWLHMPDAEDFRTQVIRKQDREDDWPFTAEKGYLACAYVIGQPAVFFIPDDDDDDDWDEHASDDEEKVIGLSVDPMEMLLLMMGQRDLLQPMKTPEELIRRIAPMVTIGKKLCDQPPGTELPGGDL